MPFDRSAFITRGPLEDVCFDFMVEADAYVAEKLFTAKPVDKGVKKVYQLDNSKLRFVETRKGTNAEPNLVDEQLFSTNITLEEHKLAREVNPRDVRDADLPSMIGEARAAKHVTNLLLIRRELLASTLATTAANYPAALTSALAAGSRWNDSGDPEADKVAVDAAMRNICGRGANALTMAVETFDKLKLSANFRDRVKYNGSPVVSLEAMKAFFNVEYIFLAKARYDSANEGATSVIGNMWGTNAIFHVYNPSPSLEDVGYGHMYLTKAPFWTSVQEDPKREGPEGKIKRVTVGTEYAMQAGFVPSSGATTFGAGYLLRTVVN